MANPKGNLAGFTGKEDPKWRENAMAAVVARQKKTHRNKDRKNGMFLFFDDGFRVLLDEAARRRNMSLTGYLRRAATAFIAHDLGLPYAEVAKYTAIPAEYGARGGGVLKRTQDDGRGHGPWSIQKVTEL